MEHWWPVEEDTTPHITHPTDPQTTEGPVSTVVRVCLTLNCDTLPAPVDLSDVYRGVLLHFKDYGMGLMNGPVAAFCMGSHILNWWWKTPTSFKACRPVSQPKRGLNINVGSRQQRSGDVYFSSYLCPSPEDRGPFLPRPAGVAQ